MIFNGPNNLGMEVLAIFLRVKKEGMSHQINRMKNRHVVSLALTISIIMMGFNNRWCWRGRSLLIKEINMQVLVRGRSRAKFRVVDVFLGINGKDFIGHGMYHMFGNVHHMSKGLVGVRREVRIILLVVNKFPEMES